jgi:hypothetical protein
MEGAFALWDPLLQELCSSQQIYTGLANQMLSRLTDITLIADESSPESEALYVWLEHLLAYNSIAADRQHFLVTLRATLLKACTLHPGFWTQKLAELILAQDAELKSIWQDLVDAAAVSQQLSATDEMGVTAGDGPSLEADKSESKRPKNQYADSVGWRRAPTRPRVPIGVVA